MKGSTNNCDAVALLSGSFFRQRSKNSFNFEDFPVTVSGGLVAINIMAMRGLKWRYLGSP